MIILNDFVFEVGSYKGSSRLAGKYGGTQGEVVKIKALCTIHVVSYSNMSDHVLVRVRVLLPNNKKLKLSLEIERKLLRTRNSFIWIVNIDRWRSDFSNFETIQREICMSQVKRRSFKKSVRKV